MNGDSPTPRPNPPTRRAPLIAARLRRGVVLPGGRLVGETDRAVHLFPLPADATQPGRLAALCGLTITPGMADVLHAVTGMPCPACLALAPHGATG